MSQQTRSQVKTFSKTPVASIQPELLRHKCVCGHSATLLGKCSECKHRNTTLERRLTGAANVSEVPPVVHEILRSPRQSSSSTADSYLKPTERRTKANLEPTEFQTSTSSETGGQSDEIEVPLNLLHGPFFSLEQAVDDFARKFNPLSIKKCEEICSVFTWSQIKLPSYGPTVPFTIYFYVNPWQHPDPSLRKDTCTLFPQIPPFNGTKKPKNFAGEIHTHGCDEPGYDNENFSPADRSGCRQSGGPCYIVTPKNVIKKL